MEIIFSPKAIEELQYWKKSGNVKAVERIKLLLEEIQKNPYHGIGKPEALKHDWSGYWSRRITGEHRFIYRVENDTLYVAQLRFHY
jgi:toxin YoeB